MPQVSVDSLEVREVFDLLEDLNDLLHQPEHLKDPERVLALLQGGLYNRLHRAYYETVWNWLPDEAKKEIEER